MRSKFEHKLITIFEVNNKLLHRIYSNAWDIACGNSSVCVLEMNPKSPNSAISWMSRKHLSVYCRKWRRIASTTFGFAAFPSFYFYYPCYISPNKPRPRANLDMQNKYRYVIWICLQYLDNDTPTPPSTPTSASTIISIAHSAGEAESIYFYQDSFYLQEFRNECINWIVRVRLGKSENIKGKTGEKKTTIFFVKTKADATCLYPLYTYRLHAFRSVRVCVRMSACHACVVCFRRITPSV